MKVLVDANVILDVLLNRSPWVDDSRRIWDANQATRIQGYLAATAVCNFYYIWRKHAGSALALRSVRECLEAYQILPVDLPTLKAAVSFAEGDFEDQIVIRCAVAARIDVIVTRDPRGFSRSPILVLSPAEFCRRYPTLVDG